MAPDSSKGALVVAAHGRRGLLSTDAGEQLPYLVRGRHLQVCCGDRVRFTTTDETPADDRVPVLVVGLETRRNALVRQPTRGGRPETLAANLSHLVVVLSASPAPDLFIADRYLCAARLMGAAAAIAWNKADLAPMPTEVAGVYGALDLPLFPVSATTGEGLAALRTWVATGTAILVGQSGVGKSTLLNRLIPGVDAVTGALSAARDEGRHTTTASRMHPLPGGGAIIDTPGVRDFAPAVPDRRDIASGFVEIVALSAGCRYTDCSHLREDPCAVRAALEAGGINARRFESYRRLMNLASQAAAGRSY